MSSDKKDLPPIPLGQNNSTSGQRRSLRIAAAPKESKAATSRDQGQLKDDGSSDTDEGGDYWYDNGDDDDDDDEDSDDDKDVAEQPKKKLKKTGK